MAEIQINLRFNRKSGKKDIIISYESDSDALPIEHEQAHQAVVEKLLETGVLEAGEVGDVHVERVTARPESRRQEAAPNDQRERPAGA